MLHIQIFLFAQLKKEPAFAFVEKVEKTQRCFFHLLSPPI